MPDDEIDIDQIEDENDTFGTDFIDKVRWHLAHYDMNSELSDDIPLGGVAINIWNKDDGRENMFKVAITEVGIFRGQELVEILFESGHHLMVTKDPEAVTAVIVH